MWAFMTCLRNPNGVSSAPQVHSGVCDYAPAFRSAINDIYNSVAGLTLYDVSGRNGWALSKHAGPTEDRNDNVARDLIELEAPLEYVKETERALALSNEEISLIILSHLDNMDDLNAAAMIDKSFYHAYKRNEASLLKNIMKAERKRTMSQASPDPVVAREIFRPTVTPPGRSEIPMPRVTAEPKPIATDESRDPPNQKGEASMTNVNEKTPSLSPKDFEDAPMSDEEALRILWPNDDPNPGLATLQASLRALERNEKCLLGDVTHVEDKAIMVSDDKHLRDDKEALWRGVPKK